MIAVEADSLRELTNVLWEELRVEYRWDDSALKVGTMVRGALWLTQVVGAGNVFTKSDIRAAFPEAAQADRRIRDLRDFDWVLHTRTDDARLQMDQTRFVAAGVLVWDKEARRAAEPGKGLSSKERQAVMERDDFMCTFCGISGGEAYPDGTLQTAVLSVLRQEVAVGGKSSSTLTTACKRCRSGTSGRAIDASRLNEVLGGLDAAEQALLASWITAGKRQVTRVERAWAIYSSLPDELRAEFGRP